MEQAARSHWLEHRFMVVTISVPLVGASFYGGDDRM